MYRAPRRVCLERHRYVYNFGKKTYIFSFRLSAQFLFVHEIGLSTNWRITEIVDAHRQFDSVSDSTDITDDGLSNGNTEDALQSRKMDQNDGLKHLHNSETWTISNSTAESSESEDRMFDFEQENYDTARSENPGTGNVMSASASQNDENDNDKSQSANPVPNKGKHAFEGIYY